MSSVHWFWNERDHWKLQMRGRKEVNYKCSHSIKIREWIVRNKVGLKIKPKCSRRRESSQRKGTKKESLRLKSEDYWRSINQWIVTSRRSSGKTRWWVKLSKRYQIWCCDKECEWITQRWHKREHWVIRCFDLNSFWL